MSTELNRIKELAGLQQEAAVGLTAQQKQGLDAINAKYGKYIGYGNGGSLPVEEMERAIDPGSTLWADDKEENELKAYMKKMGYKDLSDMESKDEEYVDNVRLPISDAMADDLQKVLGDYNDNSVLAQAAKDYLGSLGETAVAEAPASGDQALANELSSYFAKLAKEMLQNMQRPNTNDVEYEEFVDIAQAFKGGIQAGLDEVNLSRFEFSSNPFGDFGRSINDGPDEELVKILAKYGYRPGPDGDNDEATIVKQQEESAVQEAPGAEINNSTMSNELNRIRELSGLQQEAAAISPNQIEAFKKWYDTYSKMQSKDVYNYAKGIFKAYMETGVTELDGASKQDPKGKAYDDLAKIFPDMDGDIEAIGHQLKSQGVDPLDMEAQEESAVAEAPAGLTAPQKQGLAALVKKYAKRKTYGGGGLIDGYLDYLAQTGVWTDAADEKEFDVALKKLGHDDLDAWEQDAEGEELEQFLELSPITAQAQNDVEKVLGKGFYNNTNLINAASDYVKSLPETAVQPTPVLNAVKETPAMSQVDEAIKKATAQLKSFSNFDGLKPYKPKKK